ncbi:S41 family peptidase [Candidatus Kaiserbacteria bacterium]|nr:S41 family peptidase [Candidatus Kaiserbacteria bacterium]
MEAVVMKEAAFNIRKGRCLQTYRDLVAQKEIVTQPTMGRCDAGFLEYLTDAEYTSLYATPLFNQSAPSNVSFRLIHGTTNTVGYIQAKKAVNNATGDAILDALRVTKEQTNSAIIDTRNNKGGSIVPFLQVVVGFADSKDDVIYTETNPKKDDVVWTAGEIVARVEAAGFTTADIGEFADMEVTFLVNGASVSAAEDIPAAARELSNNVYVVGSKTYGKGSLQKLFELSDGSRMRVTTAFVLFGEERRKLNHKGVRLHKKIKDTREVWGDTTNFERDAQFRFAFQRYAGEPVEANTIVAAN